MFKGFQIIRFKSKINSPPFFELMSNKGEEAVLPLIGELFIKTGEIRCIGYFDGHERFPCPLSSFGKYQCDYCKKRDISKIYTRFDFEGFEEYLEKRERVKFSIYLTTFGSVVKAGLTEERRFEERIYEQGGGYYAKIAVLKGKKAYDFEYLLHNEFGIRGLIRRNEKANFIKEDDRIGLEKMKEIIEMLQEKFSGIVLDRIEIKKHTYYVPPEFVVSSEKNLRGRVVSNRGQVIFVEEDGVIKALSSSNFLGAIVEEVDG